MIYLIRHGETEANIKNIYCGSTDLPLSKAGVEKLEACRSDETVYHIRKNALRFVTSGMVRTEQTFKLLFGDVAHEIDERFREIDFGIFEMHSYHELKDTAEYQQWISGDNEANVCPCGESGHQMETRVMEAFSELRDGTAVITHGGVIAAIMSNLFPAKEKTRFDWQPAPGHGYVIVSESEYKEL